MQKEMFRMHVNFPIPIMMNRKIHFFYDAARNEVRGERKNNRIKGKSWGIIFCVLWRKRAICAQNFLDRVSLWKINIRHQWEKMSWWEIRGRQMHYSLFLKMRRGYIFYYFLSSSKFSNLRKSILSLDIYCI